MKRRFSIIGLGKLGCSMAAAIASRGIEVIGVDINQSTVELLNAGREGSRVDFSARIERFGFS